VVSKLGMASTEMGPAGGYAEYADYQGCAVAQGSATTSKCSGASWKPPMRRCRLSRN